MKTTQASIAGLIIFGSVLPFYLINDFVYDRLNPFMVVLTFLLTIVGVIHFIRTSFRKGELDVTNRHVLRYSIKLAFFFAIWDCLYDYMVLNHWNLEIMELRTELYLNNEAFKSFISKDEYMEALETSKQPLQLLFSALLTQSFLFSLIGLIFGYIYKSSKQK